MNRALTILGAVGLTGGLLLACSHDKKDESAGSSTSTATSSSTTAPVSAYDISKIETIRDQFPAGYTIQVQPRTTVTQQMLDGMKGMLSSSTFDPPACGDQLLGGIPQAAGSAMEGVLGMKQGAGATAGVVPSTITVAAVETVNPITEDTSGECDKFTMKVNGQAEGTGEKTDAPAIDGVATQGTAVTVKVTVPGAERTMDQLSYSAKLDDRHTVSVNATGDFDRNELGDLFVKAVTAVKG